MFVPLADTRLAGPLAEEGYRLVRLIERENGEKTFLRMFDDMQRYPGESEITAAFKRLVMDLPLVGFLTGHGERDFNNEGDRGYYQFSRAKSFRYALINQGFDFQEVRLDEDVPARVNILVIADPRTPLSAAEQARLDAYIARGGNLLVAGEPRRQEVMNPLVASLGVRFMPGQLVKREGATVSEDEENRGLYAEGRMYFPGQPVVRGEQPADLVVSRPTPGARALSYILERMDDYGLVLAMPGCVGLEHDGGDFLATPLFTSDSTDSWNELETTNFVDDTVRLNTAIGEVARPYPTALALSRRVHDREQRIIVLGDADCISNGELGRQRARVPAANYNLIMGAFDWMSDNEVPIDTRRPSPPDDTLLASGSTVKVSRYLLLGFLPFLLLSSSLFIWLRRRGR
jgi:ABC-2 type transport system permease protein